MGRFQLSLRFLAALSIGVALATLGARDAHAQFIPPQPGTPVPASALNGHLSAPGAVFDLATKFLRDNASAAASSSKNGGTLNTLGGGADLAVSGGGDAAVRP
ncbi:MAG TPA: hypothetical protein VJL90_12480, partial [Pseudorhodoplanes sp.]|nr:hypothetical protein [Pseudorhodoplanes sp.]